MYNNVIRALQYLGLSDAYGNTQIPLYVMNVTYPVIDSEVAEFAEGKDAVLIIEEGQPEYLEQAINTCLRRRKTSAQIWGKNVLPMGGDYTAHVIMEGVEKFLDAAAPRLLGNRQPVPDARPLLDNPIVAKLNEVVPSRPPGLCTGCPERPIFAAMKLAQQELGEFHVSADIGCHLFSILPPFNLGNTTMGFGLGGASAAAFGQKGNNRPVAIMGDGGFWHGGLTSGIGNAVFNKHDGVFLIVDNYYSSATGGQDILSSRAHNRSRKTNNPIAKAVKGVGGEWVREIDRTYDVGRMKSVLKEALTTDAEGPKIIIASSECMLNRQRREKPLVKKKINNGVRTVAERFGVDEDICTGDHACIRLSGCPSLSVKQLDDPLRDDPIVAIDNSCVGCGNCGEVSEAAALCPSFYRADIVHNPNKWDRMKARMTMSIIKFLQARRSQSRLTLKGA
jgi:indolepyruvate ferredoxin oxidoreductase alpha subunit